MASNSERIEAWIRLRDAARFARDAKKSAASIREIGNAAGSAEKQHALLNKTSERAHSLIRGIGTAAIYTVGGLGLLTGAATATGLVLGIKFNANMEQLEVAFANFLGSTTAASKYLQELYKVAATTPFEFPDLAAAARKFLAFGFTAKETKRILMTVGDTVAGIGGGADEINRVVLAFGQMKAKGRVQGEELLQLAELGIPAYKILGDEIGQSGQQLQKNLRKGAINADTAIAALERGMRKTFGGNSAKQAKTFTGMLSTMKDNAMATLGVLTRPAFDWMKAKVLPPVSKTLQDTQQWAATGGASDAIGVAKSGFKAKKSTDFGGGTFGTMNTILSKVGATAGVVVPILVKGFGVVKGVFADLLDAIKPAAPFFDNVLGPLLKGLAVGIIGSVVTGFKIFIWVLKAFANVLGFVGKKLGFMKPVFYGLGVVIGFVFGGPILRAIGMIFKFAKVISWPLRFVDGLITGVLGLGIVLFKLSPAFRFLFPVIKWLISRFGFFWGLIRLGIKLWGKFGWLIGGFVVKKLGAVLHPVWMVRGAFRLLGHVFRIVAAAIGAVVRVVVGLQDALKKFAMDKLDKIGKFLGKGKGGGLLGLGGIDKFGLAGGGTIPSHGARLVGEEGPEIATAGSSPVRITPLSRGDISPGIGGVVKLYTEVPVIVQGREVARATAQQTADWKARRGQGG